MEVNPHALDLHQGAEWEGLPVMSVLYVLYQGVRENILNSITPRK